MLTNNATTLSEHTAEPPVIARNACKHYSRQATQQNDELRMCRRIALVAWWLGGIARLV
jgi:hypothetical protein